jgi:hypothetical protein
MELDPISFPSTLSASRMKKWNSFWEYMISALLPFHPTRIRLDWVGSLMTVHSGSEAHDETVGARG